MTVRVPADWSIASVSADEQEGYLRVDDGDTPRLEIKWVSTPGFVNLAETVDKYLASIEKRARRDKQQFTSERDAHVVSKRQMHKYGLQTFTWRTRSPTGPPRPGAAQQAYGAVWVCKQCDRTVVAQVMGQPDDAQLLGTAQQVLSTIKDHPDDDWVTWAAYGFVCQVPKDFALSSQQMFSGLMKLSFARETETVTVGRWGMAATLLREQTLDEWLQATLGKELRRYGPQSREQEFRGHPAVSFSGDRMTPLWGLKSFARHITGRQCADRLLGYTWHCPQQNKIFVVHALLDRANYDLADQIRDRIECHQ